MSSFITAGTAYSTHGMNMMPFFVYYSMFGLQRIGDLVWAAADMAAKRIPRRRNSRTNHYSLAKDFSIRTETVICWLILFLIW